MYCMVFGHQILADLRHMQAEASRRPGVHSRTLVSAASRMILLEKSGSSRARQGRLDSACCGAYLLVLKHREDGTSA